MRLTVVDTGPIVALLDRNDPWHGWVLPRFNGLQGRLVTTGAVLTEAMFFLQDVPDGVARLIELVADPQVVIRDCFQPLQLSAAARLMGRYADTPMDFADATLVVLAEDLNTERILTLDERGFRTYRYGRNRSFTLVLQDAVS
jgi:hypothetical protein